MAEPKIKQIPKIIIPLKSVNEPYHKKRESIYIILFCISLLYMTYIFFFNENDILPDIKYYDRSDFVLSLDKTHQDALKDYIVETVKDYNQNKSIRIKIKERLKALIPLLTVSSLLKFDSFNDGFDSVLTSFIGVSLLFFLNETMGLNIFN